MQILIFKIFVSFLFSTFGVSKTLMYLLNLSHAMHLSLICESHNERIFKKKEKKNQELHTFS